MAREFIASVNRILLQNNPQKNTLEKYSDDGEKHYNPHTSFYSPEIQKSVFHLPHVQILRTNNCSDSRRTVFKCRK